MALSAHLGSLEAEKQKLRAQVSVFSPFTPFQLLCSPPVASLRGRRLHLLSPSFPSFTLGPLIFCTTHFTSPSRVSASSGAPSVSGEPVAEGRAGQSSAEAAGQRAGSGGAGGAQQTPAVHVLHTQIRPGGAAAGESDVCVCVTERDGCVSRAFLCLFFKDINLKYEPELTSTFER